MKKQFWIIGSALLIASFIINKWFLAFDEKILSFFQILKFPLMENIMVFFSSTVFFVLVIAVFSFLIHKKKDIFHFLLGTGIVYLVCYALKEIIKLQRPLDSIESGFGFPSGHAAVYFFIAAFMTDKFEKDKFHFILLAVIVALSRVYLNVHYLSQVISGGLLGIGVYQLYKKWLKMN